MNVCDDVDDSVLMNPPSGKKISSKLAHFSRLLYLQMDQDSTFHLISLHQKAHALIQSNEESVDRSFVVFFA